MKQRRRKQDKQKNIKNALTNFKAFYQNVRGLKSKVVSIMERFSDYQPILICLVETHLQKEEEIRISRYSQILCNDRSGKKHKNSYNRGCSGKGNWQSLWILLDSNRSKIRIGVIYSPQENVTSSTELKIMYNDISKEISISQKERQQVLILGDFNAKVGAYIEGSKPTVTKRGRTIDVNGKKLALLSI